jgi:hypothetical protein
LISVMLFIYVSFEKLKDRKIVENAIE